MTSLNNDRRDHPARRQTRGERMTLLANRFDPRRRRSSSRAGFSAVEMLIVLALLGMMMLISIPALMDFFRSMRVRTGAQRFVSHIRLCRQIAVTRRARVAMTITGSGNTVDPEYHAFEDGNNDFTQASDEVDVVRRDTQLKKDYVWISDIYNDDTPADDHDSSIDSVIDANEVKLWFYPNGQVLRVEGDPAVAQTTDTMLRIRLHGRINASRCDEWEVSLNRPGKVATDYLKLEEPDDAMPSDCTMN
jgi:prepilin-type N-terminal cleavage/methylation domain-containing protein